MGDVKVRIGVDGSQLKSGLQKAKDDVASFAREAQSSFAGFGASVAAAFSASAIIGFGRSVLEMTGHLQDASDNLNLSVESLQRLGHAFSLGGASQETFEKGMTRLNQSIQSAREGNVEAVKSFNQLGVTWEDIVTKSPEKILYLIAEGMRTAEDRTASLAAAQDILGKSGIKLAGTLKQGEEAMRAMGAEAKVLSEEQVAALAAVGDMWDTLKQKAMAYGAEVILALKSGVGHEDKLKQDARAASEKSGLVTPKKSDKELADLFAKAPIDQSKDVPASPEKKKQIKDAEDAAKAEAKLESDLADARRKDLQKQVEDGNKIYLDSLKKEKDAKQKSIEDKKKAEDELTAKQKEAADLRVQIAKDEEAKKKAERDKQIADYLKTPSQKREELMQARRERRAGRTLEKREKQRARDRSERDNDVTPPDVFRQEDPRRFFPGRTPGKQFGPPAPDKNPQAESTKAMEAHLSEIKDSIKTLEQKINVA